MDKKIVFKNIAIIFLITIFLINLTGCETTKQEATINDKIEEEIRYLEDKILVIINKYEKDEYISDDALIWNDIKGDVLEINNVIDTIILDLSETDISSEKIINFRNELNNLSIAVADEDESILINQTGILYSLLPGLIEKTSDKDRIDELELKSLVALSMVTANNLDFDTAKNYALSAEEKYNKMIEDNSYVENHSYNLNKVYVLLEEFKNAIDIEELELSKIKYINFIEKYN